MAQKASHLIMILLNVYLFGASRQKRCKPEKDSKTEGTTVATLACLKEVKFTPTVDPTAPPSAAPNVGGGAGGGGHRGGAVQASETTTVTVHVVSSLCAEDMNGTKCH